MYGGTNSITARPWHTRRFRGINDQARNNLRSPAVGYTQLRAPAHFPPVNRQASARKQLCDPGYEQPRIRARDGDVINET
jgi:hypothetical protein